MSYATLTFPLGPLAPEAIEQLCEDSGALSVTFSDASDDPVLEPAPGEIRLWRNTRVQALFAASTPIAPIRARLAAALTLPAEAIVAAELGERIWEREWLRDFHARRYGTRLWICPRHEQVADPAAVVVTLDPGLAFGTGHHPSTALCLEWLDEHLRQGERLIDYGCGSGILAIAALRLGASHADCFDIDPQALLATAENAAANGVEERLRIHPQAATLPRTDLVVANILSGILIDLAPQLAGLVNPGGRLVVAGLMSLEIHDVTSAYAPWFDMRTAATREDWACLSGTRC